MSKTVLLADNDPDYLQSLYDCLVSAGYQVTKCSRLYETIEKLGHLARLRQLPDIALIDLHLADAELWYPSGLPAVVIAESVGVPCLCLFTTMTEKAKSGRTARFLSKTGGPEPILQAIEEITKTQAQH